MADEKPMHVSEVTRPLVEHLREQGIDVVNAPERSDEEREDRDPVSTVRPELVPEKWATDRGVPSEIRRALYSPTELFQTTAIKVARRFMAPENLHSEAARCLVLSGPPGVGKSLAGAWIASHHRGPKTIPGAWWVKAEDYVQAVRGQGTNPAKCKRYALAAGILVLDDTGEEYADAAGYALHALKTLITRRHDIRGRRMVITTNLEQRPFAARYGTRVMDRLEGSGAWVNCSGNTMRGQRNET